MTRASAAQGARFRQRKLSTKAPLQILREDQVEKIDDEAQRNIPKVDTGVEKAEELEHHLQAAISASHAAAIGGKVAQSYIPTPDAVATKHAYDDLYPPRWSQPATYIRFSSTVEDCIGSSYCMDEDDSVAFGMLNQKKNASSKCSEDQFEEVLSFFENTANLEHKYAYVDGTPILSYEDLAKDPAFETSIGELSRVFAEEIYEHWSARRAKSGNRHVQPVLKFETGQDSDDGDPYVCFRRREVRQVRKTRARDNQSNQRLTQLGSHVLEGKTLVDLNKQRLMLQLEAMRMNRRVFEERALVKKIKRQVGVKGDDEDLINQRPKKKMMDPSQIAQRLPSAHLRFPQRPAHSADDSQLLEDSQADKENEIRREIQTKVAQHSHWNNNYVDQTRNPLTPTLPKNSGPDFRPAVIEFYPTPPASASSEQSHEFPIDSDSPTPRDRELVRYSTPSDDTSGPSYRLRRGRSGLGWIDRRMHLPKFELVGIDPDMQDRFKYDHDDDDEEQVMDIDNCDTFDMRYRAHLFDRNRDAAAQAAAARRAHGEGTGQANALVPAGTTHSSQQPSVA